MTNNQKTSFWDLDPVETWDTVNGVGLRFVFRMVPFLRNICLAKFYILFGISCTFLLISCLFGKTEIEKNSPIFHRNHYICSVYATRMMVPRRSGLIINIGSLGGLTYMATPTYGIGKAAVSEKQVYQNKIVDVFILHHMP